MNSLITLFRYVFVINPARVAESFGPEVLSRSDAEFIEALAVSFLIVCVYLLFWLKNQGRQ